MKLFYADMLHEFLLEILSKSRINTIIENTGERVLILPAVYLELRRGVCASGVGAVYYILKI